MTEASLRNAVQQIEDTYRRRTPASAALHERSRRVMPGGETRSSTYFDPYPVVIERGEAARVFDADGNAYLDFLNNYTVLIHGHGFPPVIEAVRRQMELGAVWAALNEGQLKLAELLTGRVASVDQLRFTNSGTEATMFAIRAARAFTGRDVIVKMEGGYHGTHDFVSASITPDPALAGPDDEPLTLADGPGVARGALDALRVAPYNDADALERILAEQLGQVAAVIVEPMMGPAGFIPAEPGYLQRVRAITEAHGAVMILDEVMTFRLDKGGAQAIYGVRPDLTTFSKVIGGGLAIGAFGGREEIMRQFDPVRGSIKHGGTFNGNPLSMAAGLAAMEHLTPERIGYANRLGASLRQGLEEVLTEQGLHGRITGMGSLAGIHLTAATVRDYRSSATVRSDVRHALHLGCLNHGLFMSPRGLLNTSTAMNEADIHQAVQAFQEALVELRPALAAECPELIR